MAAERTSGLAIILGFSGQNIANRRIGDSRRQSDGRIQFPINSEKRSRSSRQGRPQPRRDRTLIT